MILRLPRPWSCCCRPPAETPQALERLTERYRIVFDSGREPDTIEVAKPVPRPPGDPPYIVLLVRERLDPEPEPFESPLFADQFISREYGNEIFGLFVNPDEVRIYNYRCGTIVGEYSVDTAPPGGKTFYNEEEGHICFRFDRSLLPKPLTHYYVMSLTYTGE